MLGTILIIILILLLIGALPNWGYSRGWGYYPGGGLGIILIIVIILVLMEEYSDREGRAKSARPPFLSSEKRPKPPNKPFQMRLLEFVERVCENKISCPTNSAGI